VSTGCPYSDSRALLVVGNRHLNSGLRFTALTIDTVDNRVTTSAGSFDYDYLVVALGADLDHDATPGYLASGAHEFYSMEGVHRLGPAIEALDGGTLVLLFLGCPTSARRRRTR
jgi:NADPH-dependent 2,4-dienoyl-CoA reductase/sulfur reductase-like enzyme